MYIGSGETSCKRSGQWHGPHGRCLMALCIAWNNISPVVHQHTFPKCPQCFQEYLYLYVPPIQHNLEDRNHVMNACDGELPPSLAFLALRYEGLVQAKRHFPKKLRKR